MLNLPMLLTKNKLLCIIKSANKQISYAEGGVIMKKAIAKLVASAAESMAKKACGTASHFGMHQFKEPVKLTTKSK